jgi:SOS-response transcriptional repressor LexA
MSPTCPNCGSEIITARVPRTARQAEILRYVIEFQQRRNYIPSYRQIARHLGVASAATVAKHVNALKRQGLLA